MTGISLHLPEDLSNALADLAKTNGQSVKAILAMDVLRYYIEHERTLDRTDRIGGRGSRSRYILHRRPGCGNAVLVAGAEMRVEWLEKALKNLEE